MITNFDEAFKLYCKIKSKKATEAEEKDFKGYLATCCFEESSVLETMERRLRGK